MRLRHLEIFYAVMTCGSLTRAAETLHISQPAASKALKHAELRLGFALFQRIRGKLLPTQEAYLLFDQAKAIYEGLDGLKDLAENLAANPHGRLTIGCLPSLGLSLVPKVTALFLKQNPAMTLNVGTHHTADLVQLLQNRELDLGISFNLAIEGGVSVLPIAQAPLVYVDALAQPGPMALADIDQARWVHPGADSLAALIAEYRRFAPATINVNTYHMAAEFVKQGVGCSITDIFSAQQALPEAMIHPLVERLSLQVCVLHRADSPLSKA
ncbi:MAG: LysR family transcriptional regulator, partial [Neisseriaceae bacterium]|nr:LysR family transcriptional regulator [Neisseriaceae bacterium]